MNPTELVPADLYPLKQRGQEDPHHEFPLRGGVEQNFRIVDRGRNLGQVTLAQALREAYPGAVYYYMARPFRIRGFRYRDNMIYARPERYYTTNPTSQAMVFPRFQGGMFHYLRSPQGFVVESEMQVSERVVGFSELRGSSRTEHRYGPGSPYSQRPLTRFFETTGVCWRFEGQAGSSETTVELMLVVFADHFGVQERDLGAGVFHAKRGPEGEEAIQGACIYDATQGSLRLTQLLAANFLEVVKRALDAARELEGGAADRADLEALLATASDAESQIVPGIDESVLADGEWVTVVGDGEKAIFLTADSTQEVTVMECRYTPQGLMYRLEHPKMIWSVPVNAVQAIHGQTRLVRMNLMTGDTEPVDEA